MDFHLFKQMEIGMHYVQMNLQQSLGILTHHAFSVAKQHKNCIFREEVIATLEKIEVSYAVF